MPPQMGIYAASKAAARALTGCDDVAAVGDLGVGAAVGGKDTGGISSRRRDVAAVVDAGIDPAGRDAIGATTFRRDVSAVFDLGVGSIGTDAIGATTFCLDVAAVDDQDILTG